MELHNSDHDSSAEETTQVQPFRFFDLPVELRYMVYERLMNKNVYFQFLHLQDLNHTMLGARFDICFRPGMLCICKQFKDEYRYLALSKMTLAMRLIVHDGAFDGYLSSRYDGGRFFVPDVVLAEIRNVHLTFYMSNPMQSHDHLQLAEKIARKLPKLQKMTVIEYLPLRTLDKAVPKNPQIYYEYGRKLERTRDTLSSITKEIGIQDASINFMLHCPLYQPRYVAVDALHLLGSSSDSAYAHIPHVLFAASSIPDEDTFDLHGLHLKFIRQTSKSVYPG